MRRLVAGLLAAIVVVLVTAAPSLAVSTSGQNDKDGKHDAVVTVWCTADDTTGKADIHGTLVVGDDSHGSVVLSLFGNKSNPSGHDTWSFAWQVRLIHIVRGQTSYPFTFDASLDSQHFLAYRVQGQDDIESRVINRDECGFRVPEAPSTPLLLLGVLPVGGWLAVKRFGIHLPGRAV